MPTQTRSGGRNGDLDGTRTRGATRRLYCWRRWLQLHREQLRVFRGRAGQQTSTLVASPFEQHVGIHAVTLANFDTDTPGTQAATAMLRHGYQEQLSHCG